MTTKRLIAALAAGALIVLAACGGDEDATATSTPDDGGDLGELAATVGDLSIYAAVLPEPPADVAAVYFTVVNDSEEDDNLLFVRSDIADQAMLHHTVTENGTSRMLPIEGGLVIPAGGTVRLEPGGFHVMLMGVTDPPVEGDTVSVTLTFERAGDVTLDVPVRPYAEVGGG